MPIEGSLHKIGAKQQSTRVNSSLIKNLNSLKVGAIEDISCKSSSLSFNSSFSGSSPAINVSTIGHHSLSIRNINVLLFALATGYTGSNGGCGNLSSKYSIITEGSCIARSLSTRIGNL